ncbi:MAG TPA: nucleoside hydrolase [Bryobacteraceae bacterium]|nr:nucleoside hydrolase [Bryobacteraceae bacterium]
MSRTQLTMMTRAGKFLSVWLLFASVMAFAKTPVILSTDVGNEIDDQWAITYMLLSPSFEVRGILSAHGPSLPDPSAHATYKVLVDVVEHRLGMLSHPPLFEGSSVPLPDKQTALDNAGVDFIIATSKEFSKDHRLTVLTIGAATDVASAILKDPSITDRISIVAMGFKSLAEGGKEFNIENDPRAWQVILDSNAPVTIGAADVCRRDLAMSFEHAKSLVSRRGPIGGWLWEEYQEWYFRNVKPLRSGDFSKPWVIWDIVTLAHERDLTTEKEIERPKLREDLSFGEQPGRGTIRWITAVDSQRLWDDFAARLDMYQRSHAVDLNPGLFRR